MFVENGVIYPDSSPNWAVLSAESLETMTTNFQSSVRFSKILDNRKAYKWPIRQPVIVITCAYHISVLSWRKRVLVSCSFPLPWYQHFEQSFDSDGWYRIRFLLIFPSELRSDLWNGSFLDISREFISVPIDKTHYFYPYGSLREQHKKLCSFISVLRTQWGQTV